MCYYVVVIVLYIMGYATPYTPSGMIDSIQSLLDICLKTKLQNTGRIKLPAMTYGRDSLEFEEAYEESCSFYTKHYIIFGVHPNASSYLHYTKMGLLRATEPNNPFFHNCRKLYHQGSSFRSNNKIGKSEGGYICHDDLCKSVGQTLVLAKKV